MLALPGHPHPGSLPFPINHLPAQGENPGLGGQKLSSGPKCTEVQPGKEVTAHLWGCFFICLVDSGMRTTPASPEPRRMQALWTWRGLWLLMCGSVRMSLWKESKGKGEQGNSFFLNPHCVPGMGPGPSMPGFIQAPQTPLFLSPCAGGEAQVRAGGGTDRAGPGQVLRAGPLPHPS